MAVMGSRITRGFMFAAALGAGCQNEARAQAALLGPGAAFIGVGASGVATGDLDDRLTANGYPTFGRTAVAVNLGAYRILSDKILLGAEWHGLIFGEEPHEGREVGLGGGYGTLGLGYVLQVSRRARIYPRIGFGGGGMGLWIERDSVVDFDDVLSRPISEDRRTPVLSHGTAVVDLGAGIEFLPGRRGAGTIVGVRLGYLAAPFNSDWQLYDHSVTGGPSAGIAGPYVRAVIGVAWKR